MAGFTALASCDCSKSSFNSTLISLTANSFASKIYLNTKYTDASVNITFNLQLPDTVSSVCGLANGFSKCGLGQRIITFKDKMTGQLIIQWPFCGFEWDSVSSVLTFNPAQAAATCVLTARL